MTDTDQQTPTLNHQQINELADDLIRALADRHGNDAAVCEELLRWLDVLDVRGLSLVCMAAMRTTFSDCLKTIPAGPGQTGFTTDGLNP